MSDFENQNSSLLRAEILTSLEKIKSDVAPGFFEYLENLPQETFELEMSALEEVDKEAAMMLKKHLESRSRNNISNE